MRTIEFEKGLVGQVKKIYFECKLEECIKFVNEMPALEDYSCYQEAQMYKGICLFDLSKFEEGNEFMKSLIGEREQMKGSRIEEIDLIIIILYQWQIYFEDLEKAEDLNESLKGICEEFQRQNQAIESYNHGIYLFGIGVYRYIQTLRDNDDLESVNILKQAITFTKEYENQILLQIGWIYSSKNRHEDSLIWNKKLLDQCPSFPGITNNIAISYENLNMLSEAEEYYLKSEQQFPQNVAILNNIGCFYEKMQNDVKAREYFNKSYEMNGKYPLTYYFYGKFLYAIGEQEEGMKLLKKGLELFPQCCDILVELINIEFNKGQDFSLCLHYIEKCLEIYPDNGYYQYLKGQVLGNMYDYDQAIECYQKSLSAKRFYPSIEMSLLSNLALCQFLLFRYEEAKHSYIHLFNFNAKPINFQDDLDNLCSILDNWEILSDQKKIEIISSKQGLFQSKLQSLISNTSNQKISISMKQLLNSYIGVIQIIVYQKLIQPYLTYQNEISHWDMFLD